LREQMSGYVRPIAAEDEAELVCGTDDTAFVVSEHPVHSRASGLIPIHAYIVPDGQVRPTNGQETLIRPPAAVCTIKDTPDARRAFSAAGQAWQAEVQLPCAQYRRQESAPMPTVQELPNAPPGESSAGIVSRASSLQ
jgi:hypothetical protein